MKLYFMGHVTEQTQLNTGLGLCRELPQAVGAAPCQGSGERGALGQRTMVGRCRALRGSQHSSVPLPYLGGRSRLSGTESSSASLWLLFASGWRDFSNPRTQCCGLGDQHTEIPTHRAQVARSACLWTPRSSWQHRRNSEKKKPPAAAPRVQPSLQGLGRNGSGFSPDVGASPHWTQL